MDYPEATPYQPYEDTVEGSPLYSPEEIQESPNLKKFKKGKWQDVPFAIAFILFFLFAIIFGIVNMCTYTLIEDRDHKNNNNDYDDDDEVTFKASAFSIVVFLIGAAIAVVMGIVSLLLVERFSLFFIYAANIISIVLCVVSAVLSFVGGSVAGGVFILILAALNALWLFLVRSRIAFSAELLRVSAKVVKKFKLLIVLNFVAMIVNFIYVIFWVAAMIPMTDRAAHEQAKPVDGFLFFLLALSLYWTMQVSSNVCHVTTAGVTATWYFVGDTKHSGREDFRETNESYTNLDGTGGVVDSSTHRLPKYATFKALARAMTTSFGSICFGSLLVAIIQVLRYLAESSDSDGEGGGGFLRCIAICMIQCLERILQYFNNYAFVHVAIYGTSYITSAKQTFQLFANSFWQLYINDLLIDPTLNLLTLAFAIIIGVAVGLITNVVLGVFSFLLNLLILSLFFMPIRSAVTTLFVCFAEMPEGLKACDPRLYQLFLEKDGGSSIIPREQN